MKRTASSWSWRIRGRELEAPGTLVMGILNLTPDSFSDGGKYLDREKAFLHALEMVRQGADLMDLGAESTRPGAKPVSAGEEWDRLYPVLKRLVSNLSVPLSVDTTKPEVAKAAFEEGAHILNDVSGLAAGPELAHLARDFGAGLILMHRRGNPETMHSLAHYEDVTVEVLAELRVSMELALEGGVGREQLVVDPGLGFAKTAEHNLKILDELEQFHSLGLPLMLGPSRKSFIGEVTGRNASERIYGTAAVCAWAIMKGVRILRVHDVAQVKDTIRMIEAIQGD